MSVKVNYNYAPQILQKKRVANNLPNSYRILFEDAYFWESRPSIKPIKVSDNFTPVPLNVPDTIHSFQPKRDLRHHNPQPIHCNFLLQNARTLNAPQCYVKTKLDDKSDNECHWFENNYINKPVSVTSFSLDSTQRSDYKDWKSRSVNTRHFSNSSIKQKSDNIISHNNNGSDAPRFWKENLSFEHQYNSRNDPNYPIRGKRHGAFVWTKTNNTTLEDFVNKTPTIPAKSNIDILGDLQHKLACHRQFSTSRYLSDNSDAVSRLIQPDIDKECKNKSNLIVFTH